MDSYQLGPNPRATEAMSKLELQWILFVLVRVISWIVLLWDVIDDPRNHTNQHEQETSGFLTQSLPRCGTDSSITAYLVDFAAPVC
jgi:hypothetical protein